MPASPEEHGRAPGALDFPKLAQYLRALGNENRLEILHRLQAPRPASELRLAPARDDAHGSSDRTISRVAVKDHLGTLAEHGLVTTLPDRGQRGAVYYVLNHQKLFAVVEELRALGLLTSRSDPGLDTMVSPGQRSPAPTTQGPRLVLVHGRGEGRVFLLSRRQRPERGWVLGRRQGLDISLDYDPFVSGEHAELLSRGKEFVVLDLRTNVNGTFVNWVRLPKGGEQRLVTGDVVGVGKSLLLFRAD